MKIARVRLPGQQGPTIGLVDEASSEILDAGQVIQQLGLAVDASTAVELVRYNTERAGALSDAVKDLSQFSATRWPIDSLRFLAPIEAGSLKDFLAFEVHLSNARKRNNSGNPSRMVRPPGLLQGEPPHPRRPRRVCLLAPFQRADGLRAGTGLHHRQRGH